MNEIMERAKALEPRILEDRHNLHAIPELGVYTPQTAAYVSGRLREMGIEPKPCGIHTQADREMLRFAGFGDMPESTGVVGLIGQGGPCLLLRADMDALPIREKSGLPFAPQGEFSHMCGHDAHAAMLLGAAQILKDMEAELSGTVKLMFQPGEELGYGSRTMVEDGLLEHPKVDAAVALHVNSQLEVGRLQYCSGVSSGAMATFLVSIQGRGGHSSEPQKTIDPLHIATQLCSALNALVPKEVDPDEFATLTVGCLNAGRSSNIIPDTAELMISFRTLSPEAYDHLMVRIPELVELYVKAWRGTCRIRSMKTPSTFCDPAFTREVLPFVAEMLGGEPQLTPPSKGAEDFAHVTRQVPGFYAFLGAGSPENYPMHNPNMVLDERAFVLGSAVLANCAVEWLRHHSRG